MTTENNDIDPRVSHAYRDLASETTPPELDRRILSMAAGARRSTYGKARAWIRPLAWAATIGLSLAFVLELTQVPDKTPLSAGGSDGDTFEVLEDSAVSDELARPAKSDTSMRQEREQRSDDPAVGRLSPSPAAAEPASRAAGVSTLLEKKERLEGCDDDARASSESWYACIESLRESGLSDVAAVELENLLAEYPDFREPTPSR